MAKTKGPDTRPWHERAGQVFYKSAPGKHVLRVTGEPTDKVNKWKKATVDIPTDKGTFSTGSYAILRPLAEYRRKKKKTAGARITYTQKGTGKRTEYLDVVVR